MSKLLRWIQQDTTVSIGLEHSLQAGTATGADGVAPARSDTYGKGTGLGVVAYGV